MMLHTVTITGAADDTDIAAMTALSVEFPFVEWGILISKSQEGSGRFPSRDWIETFSRAAFNNDFRASTHICGEWVRSLLVGQIDWYEIPLSTYLFSDRAQLNTHGYTHAYDSEKFDVLKRLPGGSVIFQWDEANDRIPYDAQARGVETEILFDLSAGAGILPDEWPAPKPGLRCGYAGGLGPDNVEEQLQKIAAVCDQPFWIDMERRVRSDDDSVLDLAKVRRVLEICAPHVLG